MNETTLKEVTERMENLLSKENLSKKDMQELENLSLISRDYSEKEILAVLKELVDSNKFLLDTISKLNARISRLEMLHVKELDT